MDKPKQTQPTHQSTRICPIPTSKEIRRKLGQGLIDAARQEKGRKR